MSLPITSLLGKLGEKGAEKAVESLLPQVLALLPQGVVQIGPELTRKTAELLAVYFPYDQALQAAQRTLGTISNFGLDLLIQAAGQGVEETIEALWPELNELPGHALARLSETQLAQIGREAVSNLNAEARHRFQAGYTDAQIGAATVVAWLLKARVNKQDESAAVNDSTSLLGLK